MEAGIAIVGVGAGEEAVPMLVGELTSSRAAYNKSAADALTRLGPGARLASKPLVLRVEAQSTPVAERVRCARVLVRIDPGNGSALQFLEEALRGKDKKVRLWAARVLAGAGQKKEPIVAALTGLLGSADRSTVVATAAALLTVYASNERALQIPKAALGDDDWEVRLSAATGLAAIGHADERVLAVPTAMLWHQDKRNRAAAVKAIGRLGPKARAALPALRERLHDQEKEVRDAARKAAGQVGE